MSQSVLGPIGARAATSPDQLAVVDDVSVRTWSELAVEVGQVASGMRLSGARWAVLGENAAPTLIAHVAGLLGGVGTVALSRQLTAIEIVQQARDASVGGLVCGPSSVPAAVDVASELGLPLVVHGTPAPAGASDWAAWLAEQPPLDGFPEGPAAPMMVYTSGTTGKARGTEVKWVPDDPDTARDYLDALRTRAHLPVGFHLVVGPLQHNGPLVAVRHLLTGEPVVVSGRFDAARALDTIERLAVSSTVMVPTHFQRLLALPDAVRAAADVSSLRMVAHTGAGCPEAVKRAMIDWFGPVLVESYGGSESGTLCRISSDEWLVHPNSVGRPVAPFAVVVLDADGQELGPGESGRLGFRTSGTRRISYHGDPQKSAAAYIAPGVFTLGDIGHVDGDGFVYVTDRESDMVISGGVNLYPSESEGALAEHPGVADVAVIGIPEPDLGEQLLALVVPSDPAAPPDAAELEQWGRARLAAYKVPRRFEFIDELPRNEMQKIDKRALRRPYWASERTIAG